MKRKLKKIVLFSLLLCAFFMFESCTTEIQISINKDGSTFIEFSGSAGQALSNMIKAATGGEFYLDSAEIKKDFESEGFENVTAVVNGVSDIKIKMTDNNKKSYLYTSGLLNETQNGQVNVNLTAKSIKDFYDSVDEQTQMLLDLFIAPVFNGEIMTEEEYLSLLASLYGNETVEEIKKSKINIKIVSSTGNKITLEYSFAELLSGNMFFYAQ